MKSSIAHWTKNCAIRQRKQPREMNVCECVFVYRQRRLLQFFMKDFPSSHSFLRFYQPRWTLLKWFLLLVCNGTMLMRLVHQQRWMKIGKKKVRIMDADKNDYRKKRKKMKKKKAPGYCTIIIASIFFATNFFFIRFLSFGILPSIHQAGDEATQRRPQSPYARVKNKKSDSETPKIKLVSSHSIP